MRCDHCQYWRRLDTNDIPDLLPGHCHRFPPVTTDTGHDASNARRDVAAWAFPLVYASAWCGEFKTITRDA